jgi:hypothetical protein
VHWRKGIGVFPAQMSNWRVFYWDIFSFSTTAPKWSHANFIFFPRENNLILIPSGQTNKNALFFGKHHLIIYNVPDSDYPLVSSNSSYPIIIDVMSYKLAGFSLGYIFIQHDSAEVVTRKFYFFIFN